MLCRTFREQSVQIAAIAFLFAKFIRHRFYQHTNRRRSIEFQIEITHKTHHFPVFWRQRNPFVLCNHHRQWLTPLAAFFEIAFGIRFYLFTFEDQHNSLLP
ncbi:Hypothetical protein c1108 [Escherichia coli CFT073]|uniref:Uncharacterized protein n=1 Tax=Escherichia coli O6:H1 (strain CFT073 / ATCC 700928 / UPEC) TaxID=199310 RepID=A0A0H2V5X1_ECOL6|nr:Hypothetical protein c1108 [Escherichia coli CFT073]